MDIFDDFTTAQLVMARDKVSRDASAYSVAATRAMSRADRVGHRRLAQSALRAAEAYNQVIAARGIKLVSRERWLAE